MGLIAVLALGSVISLSAYLTGKSSERDRIELEFDRRAKIRHALTREILSNYENSVFTLRCLFEGSMSVTRAEFHAIASDILERRAGITALEWLPIVSHAGRPALEQQVSAEIGRFFELTEPDGKGGMMRAQPRPEHYPIVYLEPLEGNEAAFGYDLKTGPSRVFLDRARETRKFIVSFKFPLVQSRPGIVLAWAVFSNRTTAQPQRCLGFVQVVLRLEEILAQTDHRSPSTATEMLYLDDTAESREQRLLYDPEHRADDSSDTSVAESRFRSGLHRELTIEIGGRRWIVLYRPTDLWLAQQTTRTPELWLLTGLTITGLLGALLASIARRTKLIQQLVEERTQELSESRRQLSSLLYTLPGMAFRCVFENELQVIFVSEGSLALTGYEAQEFTSQRVQFRDLIHPADVETVRMATRRALQARSDVELEYRIRTRDSTEKWLLVRGCGVVGADGRLLFEGLAIDVTARKEAETDKLAIERKLLESQKLESIGLLAGGIAHDFNNLLAGILGNANLARLKLSGDSAALPHLRKIEAGTSRAAELCQQMLAYSGRGERVIETVELNELVRDTLLLVHGSFPAQARVTLELSADPTIVMADATQIRQVVMNLLLNASDALGAVGGDIIVSSGKRWLDAAFLATARIAENASPGDFVFLEVRDTGCGMTRETLSKIFDPFFTTKFTGRGLGLAAVLGIVRSHCGVLHVQSELGRGSRFTLLLPASKLTLAKVGISSSASPWQRPGKILVVDDEAPVREVAAELIRSFGMEVVTAADGREALEQFTVGPGSFGAVLLDLTMPVMNGEETLKGLQAIAPDVRVILASGYSGAERLAALATTANVVFLQKPFTRGQLERKLREVLG